MFSIVAFNINYQRLLAYWALMQKRSAMFLGLVSAPPCDATETEAIRVNKELSLSISADVPTND